MSTWQNLFLVAMQATETVAAEPDNPTTQIIVAALSTGAVGAIVAAIVTGLFSKRKLGAEATEIITKAAAGVVTNLQAEVERQAALRVKQADDHEEAMTELRSEHRAEMEEVRRVLQLHVAWDALAIARLADLGVEMPPAPPLLPPGPYGHHRHTDDH